MEALTWTGALTWLNPILGLSAAIMVAAYTAQIVVSVMPRAGLGRRGTWRAWIEAQGECSPKPGATLFGQVSC